MGRPLGSPNQYDYHWEFVLVSPIDSEVVVWSKKYRTIPEMHQDMTNTYTFAQLKSYASHQRKCPAHVIIRKIKENVTV